MSLGLGFDRQRYVGLLSKLIGETEHLQNNPPKFVPQEDRYTYYCLVLERQFRAFMLILRKQKMIT